MSDLFEQKNISPMLLKEIKEPFDDENYIFELKLDGIRCLAFIDNKSVYLQNKRHKDVTDLYPELSDIYKCVKHRAILDGELVIIKDGKPDFYAIQKRSLMNDEFKIFLAARKNHVQFVAYDILYYNHENLTNFPLLKRKSYLDRYIKEGYGLSVSRYINEKGIDFFNLAMKEKLEGIVAKEINGLYHIGKRTSDWIKIKVMKDEDLFVVGYQPDEDGDVKDLILGYFDDNNELKCRGKVYLGVSKNDKKIIKSFASKNSVKTPWFDKYKNAIWLKIKLVGTAHFMHETQSGNMRQPVWKGLRDDK